MTIQINDREIKTPQSWNELSVKDQHICYSIIMTDTGDFLSPEEMLPYKRIQLVMHLLDIDEEFMQEWAADCDQVYGPGENDGPLIFHSELKEILTACDFLFNKIEEEGQPVRYEINTALTQNPYSHVDIASLSRRKKRKTRKLYGPDDALKNISLYELGITFTYFEKYMKSKGSDHLHDLLAVLYRPAKEPVKSNVCSNYHGDIRMPYLDHESMLRPRAQKMRAIPTPTKQMILFWFASCRQHIVNRHPSLFTGKKSGGGVDFGWAGVIMSLAGGLVNLKEVSNQKQTNALTYLSYLEEQRKARALENAKSGTR